MRISMPKIRPADMDQFLIRTLVIHPTTTFYILDAGSDCTVAGCILESTNAYDMRVIAGQYRTRPLRSLRGMDVRPTSDKLRETLFNVLTAGNPAALEGSLWLDLFAGTGAIGI